MGPILMRKKTEVKNSRYCPFSFLNDRNRWAFFLVDRLSIFGNFSSLPACQSTACSQVRTMQMTTHLEIIVSHRLGRCCRVEKIKRILQDGRKKRMLSHSQNDTKCV